MRGGERGGHPPLAGVVLRKKTQHPCGEGGQEAVVGARDPGARILKFFGALFFSLRTTPHHERICTECRN